MREGRLCSGRVDTRTTALCVTGVFVRLPRLWRAPGCQHGIRRRALWDTAAMSRAGMTCSKNGRGSLRKFDPDARPYREGIPYGDTGMLRFSRHIRVDLQLL